MTFTVQDAAGVQKTANSYLSVAAFKTYHADRGVDVSAWDTKQLEQALVRATDYIEQRWLRRFRGVKQFTDCRLSFPRSYLFDENGVLVAGIPKALEEATAEYAYRALTASLLTYPTVDASGAPVTRKTEKVGPLETTIEYGANGTPETIRPWPAADKLMMKIIVSSGTITRS